ncbi:MAG: 6-phosphofructokinase [Bryobacterales bacterium]|nr:6-phosphofructokinase [Bryobacterales bacterium]
MSKLGILVGGGPAPGINSVIAAAAIRGQLEGDSVIGIRDGFEWIMKGDTGHVTPLGIDEVSKVHVRGGSILGTSRANPTVKPEDLKTALQSFEKLGISKLITIGGDDTAFSAMTVAKNSEGKLSVVHVPKTIDNDLNLAPDVDTFGYQTARHVGVGLVQNLMTDARTTSRWYLVIAMGRTAGHLALGIGKAAGATLTLIPEEFAPGLIRARQIVDLVALAITKRFVEGKRYGVAVIAEGLALRLDPADLDKLEGVERDEHGHVRLAEIPFGALLKEAVSRRLKSWGIKSTVVSKDIGYELRCADPIPYDMEYCRDLGYCAAKYILSGGNSAMISLEEGHFKPIPFAEMLDPKTGKTKVRLVDIHSTRYAIARRYMIRLRRDDFDDPQDIAALAKACGGMTPEQFRQEFYYLVENELPPLVLLP